MNEYAEGIRLTFLQLLKLPERPEALAAINALLAISTLRAPADLELHTLTNLSLVGFDGIHICPSKSSHPPHLVIRESTGPAPL